MWTCHLLALVSLFAVGSPHQAIVGRITLSTCHQVPGKTIVRSSIVALPNDTSKSKANDAITDCWCRKLRQLAPLELHTLFSCAVHDNTNGPDLAMFGSDILNEHTTFPLLGTDPVGEMSFEMNTKDVINIHMQSSMENMYLSRVLRRDGTVSEWVQRTCDDVGQRRAAVTFSVHGTGYHRTLVSNVQVEVRTKTNEKTNRKEQANDCDVALAYVMETGQYMDLDELREIQPYSGVVAVSGSWSIDVEKPAEQSNRHMVVLQTTTAIGVESKSESEDNSSIQQIFRTPIHFRYHRVRSERSTSLSCLLPPQVFVRCNIRAVGRGDENEEVDGNNGNNGAWEPVEQVVLKWDDEVNGSRGSNRKPESTRICSEVPVGNVHQSVLVSYITAISTFAGAIAIVCVVR